MIERGRLERLSDIKRLSDHARDHGFRPYLAEGCGMVALPRRASIIQLLVWTNYHGTECRLADFFFTFRTRACG